MADLTSPRCGRVQPDYLAGRCPWAVAAKSVLQVGSCLSRQMFQAFLSLRCRTKERYVGVAEMSDRAWSNSAKDRMRPPARGGGAVKWAPGRAT